MSRIIPGRGRKKVFSLKGALCNILPMESGVVASNCCRGRFEIRVDLAFYIARGERNVCLTLEIAVVEISETRPQDFLYRFPGMF